LHGAVNINIVSGDRREPLALNYDSEKKIILTNTRFGVITQFVARLTETLNLIVCSFFAVVRTVQILAFVFQNSACKNVIFQSW